tara:strand:+ start:318 stop:521 length:204 start_codon:yes stop_codon:yes gene_type:complete
MCDLREKVLKAHAELDVRYVQLQVELDAGRMMEAQQCEDRILALTNGIIADLRRRSAGDTVSEGMKH